LVRGIGTLWAVIDFGVIRNAKDPLRIIRRELRVIAGSELPIPMRLRCQRARFGSSYGGWWVRSDVLGPNSVVYSVGIGRDISFDLGLIRRYGLTVHAFDPTRKCRNWLQSQQLPANFVFTGVGLADYDGHGSFVLRSRPDWDNYQLNVSDYGAFDSEQLPVARLVTLMKRLGHKHIDVLKLDIEGSEYDVIGDVLSSNVDVRQILVEFHYDRKQAGQLARLSATVEDLGRAHYLPFARSPVGQELSLWRTP
jgi:FkbM family methyltransferase